jgi:hypothetical protein
MILDEGRRKAGVSSQSSVLRKRVPFFSLSVGQANVAAGFSPLCSNQLSEGKEQEQAGRFLAQSRRQK